MRKLKYLASYEDDPPGTFSQDINSTDDLGILEILFSWLPSFSYSSEVNTVADSAVQLFGAETNLSNTTYPLVEPSISIPELKPIEAPLLSAASPSSSDPRISSQAPDDFSIEGLYIMLIGTVDF